MKITLSLEKIQDAICKNSVRLEATALSKNAEILYCSQIVTYRLVSQKTTTDFLNPKIRTYKTVHQKTSTKVL